MFVRIEDKKIDDLYESCDMIDGILDSLEEAMNTTPSENLKGEIKPLLETLSKEFEKLKVFIEKI